MEVERGVYHALLRLGFEMYISPILALAIIQNYPLCSLEHSFKFLKRPSILDLGQVIFTTKTQNT